jgi:hypothetical protein
VNPSLVRPYTHTTLRNHLFVSEIISIGVERPSGHECLGNNSEAIDIQFPGQDQQKRGSPGVLSRQSLFYLMSISIYSMYDVTAFRMAEEAQSEGEFENMGNVTSATSGWPELAEQRVCSRTFRRTSHIDHSNHGSKAREVIQKDSGTRTTPGRGKRSMGDCRPNGMICICSRATCRPSVRKEGEYHPRGMNSTAMIAKIVWTAL